MYGEEKASPRFDAGYSQHNDGYTYFTSGQWRRHVGPRVFPGTP